MDSYTIEIEYMWNSQIISYLRVMNAEKTIDIGFATVQISEHYVISTIKEGVVFGKKQLKTLFDLFSVYYKDRPFVSIANRAHDYTIDPNTLSSEKHPELIGIGVVCYTPASKQIAAFEKTFYNGIYEIFDSLEDARAWALEFLQEYLKKAGL